MLWPEIAGKKYEIGEKKVKGGRSKEAPLTQEKKKKKSKVLEKELQRSTALPRCQRAHRRKGNAEDKTRGISNLA